MLFFAMKIPDSLIVTSHGKSRNASESGKESVNIVDSDSDSGSDSGSDLNSDSDIDSDSVDSSSKPQPPSAVRRPPFPRRAPDRAAGPHGTAALRVAYQCRVSGRSGMLAAAGCHASGARLLQVTVPLAAPWYRQSGY